MSSMRTRGKSTIVWILMGLLLLGLTGFGVTNFSGGTSDIGSVGDTKITVNDYARALRAELNDFSTQAGRAVSVSEAESIGLTQAVQARLFAGAALEEQAHKLGISVGDKVVADQIMSAGAFQGPNGQFDRNAYNTVLRREGLSEGQFEEQIRRDESKLILQRAVADGVRAPAAMVDQTASWLLETRDIDWRELTAADLAEPVAEPDEATLIAWHQANADHFTRPETRRITYVWLTPEILESSVEVDEQALRDLYQQRIAEFQLPERRMVERLVYPDQAAADAAKARLDAGEVSFEQLAAERGLSLADADLGEVSQSDLGAAGAAVFALEQPGVVGPVESDLGPALYAMNAILEPVDVPFEQAREDLASEAALDRARRQILDQSAGFEDLLAGGTTLEQLAEETPLELGQIDFRAGDEAAQGSIAGYPDFRAKAAAITPEDFPELYELEDGGVYALRLDEVVPPSLIPFEEVADAVRQDWMATETHRRLMALAEEQTLAAVAATMPEPGLNGNGQNGKSHNGADPHAAGQSGNADGAATPVTPAPVLRSETALARDGFIEDVPQDLIERAFEIAEIDEPEIVDAERRVFLVTLRAINHADPDSAQYAAVANAVAGRTSQSLAQDVFDYYTRAIQAADGIRLNQSMITSVHSRMQ